MNLSLPAGFVDNVDRAIASLGGKEAISKAHFQKSSALELRFRPEDRYCRSAVARLCPVTNLVLRVRRRKRKNGVGEREGEGREREEEEEEECSVEVLGVVKNSFEFEGVLSQ